VICTLECPDGSVLLSERAHRLRLLEHRAETDHYRVDGGPLDGLYVDVTPAEDCFDGGEAKDNIVVVFDTVNLARTPTVNNVDAVVETDARYAVEINCHPANPAELIDFLFEEDAQHAYPVLHESST
jgi:hypothetical protein